MLNPAFHNTTHFLFLSPVQVSALRPGDVENKVEENGEVWKNNQK
jgi:hypothetical protein